MKNLLFLLLTIATFSVFAQTPQAISYQTIVRNTTGEPITNTSVNVIFRIVQGSINGTEVYAEEQNMQTNEFGLMTAQIGRGLPLNNTFNTINWNDNPFFVRIEIDVNGGNNHVFMGASELLSVPYSQYAQKAATAEDDFDKDPNNELQTLSISGNVIAISEGNNITLPISFSGNYNDLTNAPNNLSDFANDIGFITSPNDADSDPTNELQNLSLSGNNLSISNGNSVTLPSVVQSLGVAYEGGRTITADAGAVRINGTDGFIITGTHNNGAEIEVSGSGTRMFFNPRRVAFRAGRVTDNRWDADSLGSYSAAFGFNAKATGGVSFATGSYTKATNDNAVASGSYTTASGINSFSGGSDALASGINSFSFGQASWAEALNSVALNSVTRASGWASTAMGAYTRANGYASLVTGVYNDTIVAAQSSVTSSTPLFIVGNGTSSVKRNAMTVLFNGNTGLNTSAPLSTLEVNGGFATTISTQSGSGSVTLNNNASVWYFTGTASVTLPTASTATNRRYIIVNRSGSARTISSYINLLGMPMAAISANSSIEIISNGTNWLQIR